MAHRNGRATGNPATGIAIIGIGCRFPGGVNDAEGLWDLVSQGRDAIIEIPENRWNGSFYHSALRDKKGKTVSRWGGFIDTFDEFDAKFFNISHREAKALDPQQRVLLETGWECFEDAGLKPEAYAGSKTGVYMGAFTLDYKILQFGGGDFGAISGHTAVGSMMTMVSNRISHAFDLRGPSMSIDTACSSSLVAVHQACLALANGDCDMALAGGVLLNFAPQYTIAESQGGFLSADGRCKTYDSRANGYVRGEGSGVVLLKPLARALADGDRIRAVIVGSGVNQDGNTNGITVPSPDAQEALIRSTLAASGLRAADIDYVEAHGTGTPVGDPIEANTIGKVYSEGRGDDERFFVGSIKTNIGHTEAAAGVAGLIKATLVLQHRQVPPNLHFVSPNPNIRFEEWKFDVPTRLEPLRVSGSVARAAVNSFGFGGTNAHVILQSYEPASGAATPRAPLERPLVFPISARSPKSLRSFASSLASTLRRNSAVTPDDVAHTLCFHRSAHLERELLFADTASEMTEKLEAYGRDEPERQQPETAAQLADEPGIAFVFAGMGPQWWGMGRQLYRQEKVFRNEVDAIDRLFRGLSGRSLVEELLADEAVSRMEFTSVSQPANFAVQAGLLALWASWGIKPSAIVGHSTGEIASLYASGVYTLEDAVLVAYHRSRLQQTLSGTGKMAALGLAEKDAAALISRWADRLSVAAVNAPGSVTIAGDEAALEELRVEAESRGVFFKHLKVEIPFHSSRMDPIKDQLIECLAPIKARKAAIPVYSTVFGSRIKGPEADNAYWWRNVREKVAFKDAIETLIKDGYRTFLELSPHPTLTGSVSEILHEVGAKGAALYSIKRKEGELHHMFLNLAQLYKRGADIDWKEVLQREGKYVKLPHYPWNRERLWTEAEESRRIRLGVVDHELLGYRLNTFQHTWETRVDPEAIPYLHDHRIQGNVLFPAAGYISMVHEALRSGFGRGRYVIEELDISRALFLDEKDPPLLQLRVDPAGRRFTMETPGHQASESHNALSSEPRTMSSGAVYLTQGAAGRSHASSDLSRFADKPEIGGGQCYERLRAMGFEYGPRFRGIVGVRGDGSECLARIRLSEDVVAGLDGYVMHPVPIDIAFQSFITLELFERTAESDGQIRLPVSIDSVKLHSGARESMFALARKTHQDDTITKGDIRLYGEDGSLIAEFLGFTVQSMASVRSRLSVAALDKWLYRLDWVPSHNASLSPGSGASASLAGRQWVVVADADNIGAALAEAVVARGGRAALVLLDGVGTDAAPHAQTRTFAYDDEAGLAAYLEGLSAEAGALTIVHAVNTGFRAGDPTPAEIAEARRYGLYSFLALLKAAGKLAQAPTIWALTKGAVHVPGDSGQLAVLQAPIWGVARLASNQEYTALWGGIVDLDPDETPEAADEADFLIDEMLASDGEDQIAFRQGRRYAARLDRVSDLTYPIPPRIRDSAAYLVTGSFGALGSLTVRWLLSRGARHFILCATQALPDRAQWDAIGSGDKAYERVAFIRELEEAGALCDIAVIDMCDESGWRSYIDQYKRSGKPRIRGVINVAGIVRDRPIAGMDEATFDAVYDPKALGNWILHDIFRGDDLDFFVMYSSIAALVTSAGQANYAAGNAFIDALAQYRSLNGLPALSIGWGPWAVGMIKDLNLEELYRARGMDVIEPDSGMQVLERLVNQSAPHVAVVSADWRRVIDSGPKASTPYLDHLAATPGGEPVVSDAERLRAFTEAMSVAAPDARHAIASEHFKRIVGKVLHAEADSLADDASLNALGIDSMMAIELKNRIELNMGAVLSVVDILSSAPIGQLVGKIVDGLAGQAEPADAETVIANADAALVADLASTLDGLSDEEAELMLAELKS